MHWVVSYFIEIEMPKNRKSNWINMYNQISVGKFTRVGTLLSVTAVKKTSKMNAFKAVEFSPHNSHNCLYYVFQVFNGVCFGRHCQPGIHRIKCCFFLSFLFLQIDWICSSSGCIKIWNLEYVVPCLAPWLATAMDPFSRASQSWRPVRD